MLTQQAPRNVSFMLCRAHSEQAAKILTGPKALDNNKYVVLSFLRNAEAASEGKLPLCQDTGTVIIHGEKERQVWTGFCDGEVISHSVYNIYTQDSLHYSQNAPFSMYDEVSTRCNLPTQIDLEVTGGMEYKLLLVAKGGSSANKTYLCQMTKTIIQDPGTLVLFLAEKMKSSGTAVCPPYHIAFVIRGTSAEKNLLIVRLASTRYYDSLPTSGDETGRAFRDIALEKEFLDEAHKIRLGAQFGGKCMVHDIQVARPPRHGALCSIGMDVSCSADRNIKAKINRGDLWIKKLDENPGLLIPEELCQTGKDDAVEISFNQPTAEICKELSQYPVSTRVSLNGVIIVARNIVHTELKARLDVGEESPEYFKNHLILYAGSAKTPEGTPYGSMGPTITSRMDPYVDEFQDHGGSTMMITKGNRTQAVTDACRKHGGFYLGSIGGPATVLLMNSIKSIECVRCSGLGMEAIWKIDVADFPALILVNDKRDDFFKQLEPWTPNYTK